MTNDLTDDVAYEPLDYDNQTIAIMKRVLNNKSNCIDVGCHVGGVLEVILQLAPDGTHLAFEPIPDLYHKLKEKYSRYSNVTIYNYYALSDATGETSFRCTSNKAYSGLKKRSYDRPNRFDLKR